MEGWTEGWNWTWICGVGPLALCALARKHEQKWSIGTGFKFQVGRRGQGEEEDGAGRALYALALTGRWKYGQGEEEDGPWVVKVRTESCHWTGMSGRGPVRPWEVWASAPRPGRRRRNEE